MTKHQATVEPDDSDYSTLLTGATYGVNVPTEQESKEGVSKEYYKEKLTVPNTPTGTTTPPPYKEPRRPELGDYDNYND